MLQCNTLKFTKKNPLTELHTIPYFTPYLSGGSFPVRGSFVGQFGDHLRARDHLPAGRDLSKLG